MARCTVIYRRHGITLVELLVVIGVITVLTGLLLPAVQLAREAARRAACMSNLRQIGVAMHAYAEAYGQWPFQGDTIDWQGPYKWRPHITAQAMLLPYLGMESIYNSINVVGEWPTALIVINRTAFRTRVEVFLCPSDNGPRWENGGGLNYRLNDGWDPMDNPLVPPNSPVWPPYLERITDGLSQTALFSERVQGTGRGGRSDPFRDLYMFPTLGVSLECYPPEQWIADCAAVGGIEAAAIRTAGEHWGPPFDKDAFYKHTLPPNSRVSGCIVGPAPVLAGIVTARSWHPGGVNVLMADGAVRFFGDSVNLDVWRAISTADGRELVSF